MPMIIIPAKKLRIGMRYKFGRQRVLRTVMYRHFCEKGMEGVTEEMEEKYLIETDRKGKALFDLLAPNDLVYMEIEKLTNTPIGD